MNRSEILAEYARECDEAWAEEEKAKKQADEDFCKAWDAARKKRDERLRELEEKNGN